MSAESIIGLYERHALAWSQLRRRGAFIEKSWLEKLQNMLPESGSVLDLGCGAGEPIARWLIERKFRVTGVDSSGSLIALCRAEFSSGEWIEADMRRLALGRSFDGVIAWHSFFHLSPGDQREMFNIFARHTASGGALMFTSGDEEDESTGEFQGEPLYHASLSPEEYRKLLDENDFDIIEHRTDDPECGGATVWLARRRSPPVAFATSTP